MEQLFREFYWVIFVVLGIVLGLTVAVVAIVGAFRTRQRSLDVLRVYAERGEEPPAGVLRAVAGEGAAPQFEPVPRFGFFLVLGLGCGFMWFYLAQRPELGLLALIFFIATIISAALAAANLLRALTSRKP